MSKEQLYRVLFYAGGSLIDVKSDQTQDDALAMIHEWTDEALARHVVCEPRLTAPTEEPSPPQDNKVLPTPMGLYSFETSIGEILVASDDEATARAYVGHFIGDYVGITNTEVTIGEPNNVAPVHAVFLAGQSLTDFLDPSEVAEFDHPGITQQ